MNENTANDDLWVRALVAEFKIGGAMHKSDLKWVMEQQTVPERWARIVRLAVTPAGVKLHDYPEDPVIDLKGRRP